VPFLGQAKIVIDQATLPPGVAGVPRDDGVLGQVVTLRNADNTNISGTTGGWLWVLFKPRGSAATLSSPTSPTCSFTPDVDGTYRVELYVNEKQKPNQKARSAIAVRDGAGFRYPAQGESNENTWTSAYTGQPNETGWWEDINDILRSGQAAIDGTHVTATAQPGLPNSRRLQVGAGLSLVDGGPGGDITLDTAFSAGTKLLADVGAQPENIVGARTVEPPTRDNTKYGQTNLGSESLPGLGTKANYASIGGGLNNLADGLQAHVGGGNANVATGTASGVLAGVSNVTQGVRSVVVGGNGNSVTAQDGGVVAGNGNIVSAQRAGIVSGNGNTASAVEAFVGAGNTNTASGIKSGVVAGSTCTASGLNSAVVAGDTNVASNTQAVVVGGNTNQAQAEGSIIGAGSGNLVSGQNAACVGGSSNSVAGQRGFVGAGNGNSASAQGSSVCGGDTNTASGQESHVGGGNLCTASGLRSVVVGGRLNGASGICSFIGGGVSNSIGVNSNAVICGGDTNSTGDDGTFVGGGTSNSAAGPYASVVGGSGNNSSGNRSHIGGGSANAASGDYSAVAGGSGNSATSSYTSALAGRDCLASASDAHALGRGAQATNSGAVVIKDGAATTQASSAINQLTLRFDGGIRQICSGGKITRILGTSTNNYTEVLQGQQSTTDGSAQTVNIATIPSGADCTVRGTLKGKQNGSANGRSLAFWATYTNNGGAVAIVGSAHVNDLKGAPAWSLAVGISGTHIQLQFTGAAATTIRWTWDFEVHYGGQT